MHAWVLHKRWTGDTSAYVTFFTEQQGVVCCLSKGARVPKKQSLLQAFTPLWLVVDTRREWHYLRQIEIAAPALIMQGTSLFSALYVNELLHHTLRPSDPQPLLYSDYIYTLQVLATTKERLVIEATLRRFEWRLLLSIGYEIILTHDAYGVPLESANYYNYVAGHGFILAAQGVQGAHILAFSENSLQDMNVLKSAKWIMRQAIDYALDGKLVKTRALFKS